MPNRASSRPNLGALAACLAVVLGGSGPAVPRLFAGPGARPEASAERMAERIPAAMANGADVLLRTVLAVDGGGLD